MANNGSAFEEGLLYHCKGLVTEFLRGLEGLPPESAAATVALLVVCAREQYGRELTDRCISESQARRDTPGQEICEDCHKAPAVVMGVLCQACDDKAKQIEIG